LCYSSFRKLRESEFKSFGETMTTTNNQLPMRAWIVAFFMGLILCAPAQPSSAAANSDLRLWSFGDCERTFPRADSRQYQECVRVVGSPEAKDLRAQRACEDGYAKDPKGLDLCVSASRQTKRPPLPDTTLSPEMTLKVQSIAAAAVEQQSTAGTAPISPEPAPSPETETPTPHSRSSTAKVFIVSALGFLMLGAGGVVVLRKHD